MSPNTLFCLLCIGRPGSKTRVPFVAWYFLPAFASASTFDQDFPCVTHCWCVSIQLQHSDRNELRKLDRKQGSSSCCLSCVPLPDRIRRHAEAGCSAESRLEVTRGSRGGVAEPHDLGSSRRGGRVGKTILRHPDAERLAEWLEETRRAVT